MVMSSTEVCFLIGCPCGRWWLWIRVTKCGYICTQYSTTTSIASIVVCIDQFPNCDVTAATEVVSHVGRQRLLVCIMVTSCAVVGCARRHAKGVKVSFYRFPWDGEKRSLWIGALPRKNADKSNWIPSEGVQVCGDQFTTGAPHKDPSHPDFIPSVAMGYDSPHAASKVVPGQLQSRQSLGRFILAQQRREAWISLAAEAAEDAERAQHLLHVQQKRVRQRLNEC